MSILALLKKGRSFLLAVLIVAVCAYTSVFHVQLLLVRGDSMYPAYRNFTFALLNKHKTSPQRGDVIAFRVSGIKGALIKRVVGIPGDVLHASEGELRINETVQSDYTNLKDYGALNESIVLSEGEYFVLGDNTEESRDSRYEEIGMIHVSQIYGTVWPCREYQSQASN